MCFSHIDKETIHILASLATIAALVFSICFFISEINRQKEFELKEHISNIKSLEQELELDLSGLYNLKEKNLTAKTIHAQLVLENLKRSVADGKIINYTIKNETIITYFDGVEFNQRLSYVNSPEFASLRYLNRNASQAIENLVYQDIQSIEEDYIPSFESALSSVKGYRECLETKQEISAC